MQGVIAGILGCIFGVIGVFAIGFVFVPLAAACAVVGLIRGISGKSAAGIGTSLVAGVLSVFGFVTSPSLWLLTAGVLVASHLPPPATTAQRATSMPSPIQTPTPMSRAAPSSANPQLIFCLGASHMGCYEGIDTSGRSPQALYEAAVEALREAATPAQQELARRAMKDAFNPAVSDQRAVVCNQAGGGPEQFQRCMNELGSTAGLKMTVSCQQNLSDGRMLIDGRMLPTGTRYNVLHYRPELANEGGWTRGECEIIVA